MILKLEKNIKKYKRLLNGFLIIDSLDGSKVPKINFRKVEQSFNKAFNATDHAKKDISIDSQIGDIGIGIKTFQTQTSSAKTSLQKIAEFNDKNKYPCPSPNLSNHLEIAKTVAGFRNLRLRRDIENLKLKKLVYHLVHRRPDGVINILEQNMNFIDIEKISIEESTKEHIVSFSDGLNNYNYNSSKSTLFMSFDTSNPQDSFIFDYNKKDIDYLLDQFESSTKKPEKTVSIPLFDTRKNKVHEKSGLNQWNAAGRKRHPDEVYIPINRNFHIKNPNFFPSKDDVFRVDTDNGKSFFAKLCQQNSKAFMSNPNKELGSWILRDNLNLREFELVTFKILVKLNSTHIKVTKFDNSNYYITMEKKIDK